MIHRINQQSADDPFKRGKAGKFGGVKGKDYHVEKASEVDPEEKKRRKFQQHLEEKKKEPETDKKPSPYESAFYDKGPAEIAKVDKKLPAHDYIEEKSKIEAEKAPLSIDELEMQENEERRKVAKEENLFVPSQKKIPSKKEPREPLEDLEEKKTESEEAKDTQPLEQRKKEIPFITAAPVIPPDIAQIAHEAANDLKVSLTSEVPPVFEQMVGQILVMNSKEGIMQTEILLNNPEMEGSVFYGSKIVLEKYSTAPDSFNIKLTGNPEAVAMFNGNIDILMETFSRGNFNFRIGRIEAAYETERPLFRRKERPGGSDVGGGPLGR